MDAIPGAVNCDTTVKISGETYNESVVVRGKNLTGNYTIKLLGSMTTSDSGTSTGTNTNAFPITQTRFNDTGKAWTASAHIGRLLKLTGGTGSTQTYPYRIILGNSATYLDLTGVWDTLPDATSTYRILGFATTIDSASSTGNIYVAPGQKGITVQHIAFIGASAAGVWTENASVNILGCKFANVSGYNTGIYYTAGSTGESNINYIPASGPGYGIRITSSYINAYHNYLIAGTASTAALFIETAGGVSISSPYLKGNYLSGGAQGGLYLFANAMLSGMDNCWVTGGTYGIHLNHNSVARIVANNLIENAISHGIFCNNGHILFASSASSTNIRNNGGWGVYGQLTSTGQNMTVPTYTTNTSGTWSFAAASYSYGS
ncbi:MAG: hypothetical protein HY891_07750 [Deltaproteobacteria bacterium]|nr:hypothetical protein [Deltaproteobacteria bacterium]